MKPYRNPFEWHRTSDPCPNCIKTLRGKIVGPKAECRLFCVRCHWSGNTDILRGIHKAHFQALLQDPKVIEFMRGLPPTEFVGYDTLSCTANIIGIVGIQEKAISP